MVRWAFNLEWGQAIASVATIASVVSIASKAAISLILVLGLGAAVMGDDQDQSAASAAALAALVAAHHPITTVHGHAIWTTRKPQAAAGEERVQNLEFYLQMPDHYYLKMVEKDDEDAKNVFFSDGVSRSEVSYFAGTAQPAKVTPVGHGNDAGEQFFNRLLAAFRLDTVALQRDYTLTAAAQGSDTVLTLKPLHDERSSSPDPGASLVFRFNGKAEVQDVAIDEPEGNHDDIRIVDAEYDVKINQKLFAQPKPEN